MIKRYAIVGTGNRAEMFVDPLAGKFRGHGRLVGLCDSNPARMSYYNQRLEERFQHPPVPAYAADDFDRMIQEQRPDVVIVCTVDALHDRYIIRAMELGCDVITEKPMTTDEHKCGAILRAAQRSGRRVRVTFNARWRPATSLVKRLLSDGTIGQVIHADMEYALDTSHGADYFRRWHREKDKSGGLIIHKATHHFDLVNWWLDAVPEEVYGYGQLAFYGHDNALKRGLEVKHDRYTGQDTAGDPFAYDLNADEKDRKLYLEAEAHDGYHRDRNVFGDNITIEDTMSLLVKYRTGVVLNYSLNAYVPREFYTIVFNGTAGRIEYREEHGRHVLPDAPPPPEQAVDWQTELIVHPMFGRPYRVPAPQGEGGHGGGDPLLQEQMFSPDPPADELGRHAGQGQGAASILIGAAANRSFISGQPVRISELCPELGTAVRLTELP